MKEIIISPSLLSADFTDVKGALKSVEDSGAKWIHCDVMDGVFVPNISFGQKMVGDVKKATDLVIDAHLMIVEPIKYVEEFARNGADFITVHYEACSDVEATLKKIKEVGCKAGLALKPKTDVSVMKNYLDLIDLALIMSVEPGFSGQKFIFDTLKKYDEFCEMAKGKDIILQGDGGINGENAREIISHGVNCIVAGNAFFKAQDKKEIVRQLGKR